MGKIKPRNRPQGAHVMPMNETVINEQSQVVMPGMVIPSFRTSLAMQRKCEKNIMINTWGGLGDQVCAEPAIRFGLRTMGKGCEFSLASEAPGLFRHLNAKFKRVFDLKQEQPIWQNYFMFRTIHDTTHLQWEFMSHMIVQAVDYVSLCMWRCMLPIAERTIILDPMPSAEIIATLHNLKENPWVLLHPGRHWPIKTFPKDWWDHVIQHILDNDVGVAIMGANTDDNRGTVDVMLDGVVDLRNKTPLQDMMYLCQNADVLLTNDSSPLHMAASGNAWIGFIATCKHPDYIMHWRTPNMALSELQDIEQCPVEKRNTPEWAWRMKNFGKGGIWDKLDYMPNKEQEIRVDKIDEETLRSWLPDPIEFANWAIAKAVEEYEVRHA